MKYLTYVKRVLRHSSSVLRNAAKPQQVRSGHTFWSFINMGDIEALVTAKIAGKKVMIFSKSYCPFCTKAKRVFDDFITEGVLSAADYEVMEIENDPKCEQFQDYLHQLTGGRSVPRVFIKGKFVGGGDDTVRMKSSGELKAILT